ncbi:UxaA family hydrolase [Verminephrobacter eiseniae]|uniref:UxaA family hydrolase n=1 Tax=Verminephrobacter eiseniae TaxID=364317 RepID=UPI002237F48E|nr:UxaA family hydrolase [Verminephrobacter eiseniae]MCW5285039.1 altronate hydrolase [Verminephrobacter eiseniae]MCW5302746.1 altronate hydrolase [Verminephrobacter eiseniae]MCW8180941.1 altronate hydrolase [Verminephrobacter eiseniae]MCW8190765.1 altronate hydrolase [Verminephrobacter eiseniae]
MSKTFLGFRRGHGPAGVRNGIAVISVMDNCNPATRAIAQAVDATLAVTTSFVRGQFGADLEFALDSLAGLGRNPNIAGVLLVGLEESSTEEVARRIRPAGKPVEVVHLQPNGTIECVAQGTRLAARMVLQASQMRRQPCPMSDLVMGVECGGSDTTSGLSCNPTIGRAADRLIDAGGTVIISETSEFIGAEHLFAARAVDATVRQAFLNAVQGMEAMAVARGVDMRDSQPAPDNKRGGLSTVEEKALGALAKAGKSPLVGVLGYGQAPARKGLHFMDAPSGAVENLTGLAAGGCQLICFGTGVGNPIGNMVAPTIKICGNVNTVNSMRDNIDFDVSAIFESSARIADLGDQLYDYVAEVGSGTRISSEILNIRETAVSRFERSL